MSAARRARAAVGFSWLTGSLCSVPIRTGMNPHETSRGPWEGTATVRSEHSWL
jgi:hypothetical protein